MSNLGLPLEYQTLPEFFDSDNGSDTCDWASNKVNSLIDEILSKNNVFSVLDMTCGTGSQVLYLDSRGYSIIGSDFSTKLVETAIDKANALGRKIEFIHGDMRTVKLGKFDAVITIF
jgi:2-polyprenyl-3-methyl-5-hydroxy-6-metoxy-1,4-benzoquinol methylase